MKPDIIVAGLLLLVSILMIQLSCNRMSDDYKANIKTIKAQADSIKQWQVRYDSVRAVVALRDSYIVKLDTFLIHTNIRYHAQRDSLLRLSGTDLSAFIKMHIADKHKLVIAP